MSIIYGLHIGDSKIRYVGQSSRTVQKRFSEHVYFANRGDTSALYYWMRKYGTDSIQYQVLEHVVDATSLNTREIYWIAELNTFNGQNIDGLNCTTGGQGLVQQRNTSVWTEERREARSQALKVLWQNDAHRLKMSQRSRELWTDPEYRAKMSPVKSGDPRVIAGSRKGVHVRCHVKRDIVEPTCELCNLEI